MNHPDTEYLNLLEKIMNSGEEEQGQVRTGTWARSIFGYQMRFSDVGNRFPLLTTKKMASGDGAPTGRLKNTIWELVWFLNGYTRIKWLIERGCNIWNDWCAERYFKEEVYKPEDGDFKENFKEWWTPGQKESFKQSILQDEEFEWKWGDLGPVYGKQWRNWVTEEGEVIDQMDYVAKRLQLDNCRRVLVTAWNPGATDKMALPPCHCLFQFRRYGDNLDLQLYQRSCDTFLGVPFNVASYATMLLIIAHYSGLKARNFVWTGGDVHVYNDHFEQVTTQMEREPFDPPSIELVNMPERMEDLTPDNFIISGYQSHGPLKGKVSV
jgi:thymidylate synthase